MFPSLVTAFHFQTFKIVTEYWKPQVFIFLHAEKSSLSSLNTDPVSLPVSNWNTMLSPTLHWAYYLFPTSPRLPVVRLWTPLLTQGFPVLRFHSGVHACYPKGKRIHALRQRFCFIFGQFMSRKVTVVLSACFRCLTRFMPLYYSCAFGFYLLSVF